MTKNKTSSILSLLCIFFILILSPHLLRAQNSTHIDTSIAVPLRITFPVQQDTVEVNRLRIAGCTSPDADVTVNHKRVKVYASGAFVDRIPLEVGLNVIPIKAQLLNESSSDTLFVFRKAPLRISPESPTQIDPHLIEPTIDIIVSPGDLLRVRFKGSPGGRAQFSIPELCKNVAMTELPPDDAEGMKGIYQGMIKIRMQQSVKPTHVKFELIGKDGKKVKAESKGSVSVLGNIVPLVGKIVNETSMWNAPEGGASLGVLPEQVRIEIVGKIGGRFKARFSDNDVVWLDVDDVRFLPLGTAVPRAIIGSITVTANNDWVTLGLSCNNRVPFKIEQYVNPAVLDVYLYGAHQGSQWLQLHERDATIAHVSWEQPGSNVYKLHVELNQTQQWGYRAHYGKGRFYLSIRKAPTLAESPESPVKGIIFVLDPGHGGDEKGAVGATGLEEKDVNLQLAQKLKTKLLESGARVVMTRDQDISVSLEERLTIARSKGAQIFIMLHNNSVGLASNPLVRGISVYHSRPHSKEIAAQVYSRLKRIGVPAFGNIISAFHITRQTDMIYFLVEGAFITNPEDEMLLLDDSFLDKMAHAIFAGLEDFLRVD